MYKRKIDELKQVRQLMIDHAGVGEKWNLDLSVRRVHSEFCDDLPHTEEYYDLMYEIQSIFPCSLWTKSTERMSAKTLVQIMNAIDARIDHLAARDRRYEENRQALTRA